MKIEIKLYTDSGELIASSTENNVPELVFDDAIASIGRMERGISREDNVIDEIPFMKGTLDSLDKLTIRK